MKQEHTPVSGGGSWSTGTMMSRHRLPRCTTSKSFVLGAWLMPAGAAAAAPLKRAIFVLQAAEARKCGRASLLQRAALGWASTMRSAAACGRLCRGAQGAHCLVWPQARPLAGCAVLRRCGDCAASGLCCRSRIAGLPMRARNVAGSRQADPGGPQAADVPAGGWPRYSALRRHTPDTQTKWKNALPVYCCVIQPA